MQATQVFCGLWIPLITPFCDGAVDHAALDALVRRLRGTGIRGFVVCGSTGEAAALDHAEQCAALATVHAAAAGLPLMMGVSGYHLPAMLHWVRQLAQQPVSALLVPAPHYIRPSQAGLLHWFRAIADATALPLILYDIPYRTGSSIDTETLLTLAAHPRILAIKDCGGDKAKTQALLADGRLQVLAGEDAQIHDTVAMGGSGAIAACAHIHTERLLQVLALLRTGERARAAAMWQPLQAMIRALFSQPNPAGIKAVLATQGLIRNELRPPMMPLDTAAGTELVAVCAGVAPVPGPALT